MNNIEKMEDYKSKYFDEPLESSTDTNDIRICKNCYLWSKDLNLCLLNGEDRDKKDSCNMWLKDILGRR